MAIDITIAILWTGPRNQYDLDDIIDVFPYTGDLPPPSIAPWVHLHCLNAPWNTLDEAKEVLLAPNAEDEPANPPPDYDPVVMNARDFRVERSLIPANIRNQLGRDRTYTFDFSIIADSKVYSKKLQRILTLADWGLG